MLTRAFSLYGPKRRGKHVRNISKYAGSFKSTELKYFKHLISPILLNGRLDQEAYVHWAQYALATKTRNGFQVSLEEKRELGRDMMRFVREYERIYYRYERDRLKVLINDHTWKQLLIPNRSTPHRYTVIFILSTPSVSMDRSHSITMLWRASVESWGI